MLPGNITTIANQIKSWVMARLGPQSKEVGVCKKFVLRHLNVEGKAQGDVANIAVQQDHGLKASGSDAEYIVMQVATAAQQDANDYKGGIQKYALYAYFTNDSTFAPRKIFRVAADEEMEEGTELSEPPTEKGLLTQMMRHNEINIKNSLVSMGYMFQTFTRELGRLRDQNERYGDQHLAMVQLIQEMMDGFYKRRIDERQADMHMSMVEGVFEHLKVALPVIVNRLAGKDLIPQKIDKGFYMLAALLEGMSPDQQKALQETLSPQQLTLLAEILQIYEEKKGEFEGGKPNGKTNGAHTNGNANGASAASSAGSSAVGKKLLTMFERRGELVKTDRLSQLEDEKVRSIEARARDIMKMAFAKAKEQGNSGQGGGQGQEKDQP